MRLLDRYQAGRGMAQAVLAIAQPRQITSARPMEAFETNTRGSAQGSIDWLAVQTLGAITTAGGGDPDRTGWALSVLTGGIING